MNCRCIDFPDYKLETEAATWSVIERRDVLKNSKNFQENTCARVFSVNLAKFLRTPFLQNTSWDCFQKRSPGGIL